MKSMELFFDKPGIYKVTEKGDDKVFLIVVSNSCVAIRLDNFNIICPCDEFEDIILIQKIEFKY